MNISEAYKNKLTLSKIGIAYNDLLDKDWLNLKLSIDMAEEAKENCYILKAKVKRRGEDITNLIPSQGFKWDLYYTKKDCTQIIKNKKTIIIDSNLVIDNVKASFALVKMGSEIFEYSKESNES